MWFKYEIMAIEHISSLPLRGEGIETVAYAATMLGHTKFMMGHLELAIDLGKGSLSKRGRAATCDTRKQTRAFSPQAHEPRSCGRCSGTPRSSTEASAGSAGVCS